MIFDESEQCIGLKFVFFSFLVVEMLDHNLFVYILEANTI